MKKLSVLFTVLFALLQQSTAQIIADPTTWTYTAKKIKGTEYELIIKTKLKPHWHIWSMTPGGDGSQLPTTFTFNKSADYVTNGSVKEAGKLITKEFEGVDGACNYFENEVTYTQKVKLKKNTTISGSHSYQVCDEKLCLPPKTKKFSIDITDAVASITDSSKTNKTAAVNNKDTNKTSTVATASTAPPTAQIADTGDNSSGDQNSSANTGDATIASGKQETNTTSSGGSASTGNSSLLKTWITGFGWGLASVLTPCVFAMLPMTVGFFLKRSKSKAQGRKNAMIYAISIILILTALGALISLIGGNTLNNLSTNWIVNLVFFAIFLIFGISFLGAFELTLPSSLSTATDSKANTNSIVGIFFMALTLVIVSFSCTGPFLGNMLVESIKGGKIGPTMGFNGFAVGLALPFAATALFPELLNKASQGGWLNAVKVTFGIVELALALKFLSNADLARQWRLLDREVFLAIWITLALVLAFYLFGFIKFSHDSGLPENHFGVKYLTVTRSFFAIAALAFAIYMIPGLWGAPLKGLSAFLPPMGTQDYVVSNGGGGSLEATSHSSNSHGNIKYADKMRIYEPESVKNFGLTTVFDYKQALEISKKENKPIMLDFTGINCVNCRKMEAEVWSNPEVLKLLKEKFIIASLYCDVDNITLPENEQYESKYLDSKVTTLGDLNEDLQATKFNSNSQPYYFFVDGDGNKLAEQGYGYDPNVPKFIAHLNSVLAKYGK